MKLSLYFILLITLLAFKGFGQERMDTTQFNPDYTPKLSKYYLFDSSFCDRYPMSGEFNVSNQKQHLVFEYDQVNGNTSEFISTPEKIFYHFSSNGYQFWQNSKPLAMGFSYHLKEAFGWDKFDVFMNGGSILINDYEDPTLGNMSPIEKAFYWEAALGVGYKVSKESTIFIKSSVQFRNFTPVGNRHLGGVNMKF